MNLIIIGDFGKDMDDEDTLVLSDGVNRHHLVRTEGSRKQELFEMLAVVANLAPATQRARLAKGTLNQLRRPSVPVGIGTDCGMRAEGHEREFVGVPYMAPTEELCHGAELLVRTLESCPDGTAVLLLISGLTDAAQLLQDHAELVSRKVKLVAIMGGVKVEDDKVVLDSHGFMVPDPAAANNKFDMGAALYVYRRFQELQIPLTILTREAAYAAPVPRELYDRMAETGHAVGIKLRHSQQTAIENLWFRTNLPFDDVRRDKLPERCNRDWFRETFLAGEGKERGDGDEIWDLVKAFQLYDPMTLIAAIPELCHRFFEPVAVTVKGTVHKIIGVSKSLNGVKDAPNLVAFMTNCFIGSLTANKFAQRLTALAHAIAHGKKRGNTRKAYGRIIRWKSGQLASLTDSPLRRTIMITGPQGIRDLFGKTGWQMLSEIGYPEEYVKRKLSEGCKFSLVLFARPTGIFRIATWKNTIDVVALAHPELAPMLKAALPTLKKKTFLDFELEAGFTFEEVDAKGLSDPRFMTAERLAVSDGSPLAVRRFLYHVERLNELFTGDGYTLTREGRRGVREYVMLNRPLAELVDYALVDLKVEVL